MSEYCITRIIHDNFLLENVFHAHTWPATSAKCDAGKAFLDRTDAMWAWNMFRTPTVYEEPMRWHGRTESRGVRGRVGRSAIVLVECLDKNGKKDGKNIEVTHPLRPGSTRVHHEL
jgi:hypothetical protein